MIAYINCLRPGVPYWTNIIPALTRQAATLGYQVQAFNRSDFGSSAKLQRELRNRGITDVIISPVSNQNYSLELDWPKFICIQLLPGFSPLPLHSVVRDHFNTVLLAWQKAVSYGYRRIGVTLLDHPFKLMDDVMRLCGVSACQQQLYPELPVIPAFHFPGGDLRVEPFGRWIEENEPDVIIGFNTAHHWALHGALKIDLPYAGLEIGHERHISGIPEHEEILAVEGVNLLHYCRRSYQWGIPSQRIDHVLEPVWHEGTSMPRKTPA